ncbi:hypothetical protein A7D00_2453 [Trichophyton violaceum]|uniref:Histidine acid phosphatase n=1 Tax=Trichophyton violaceum TaxID=34388 RepID=A0A178FJG2_TRIVO|nr:hypothetical protein A7D00_2453 [Trichophyton violaceum]
MLVICFFFIFFIAHALAQDNRRQITWGSVVFTRHGETVPLGAVGAHALTPVGAQQLVGAGRAFRQRYITPHRNPNLSFFNVNGLSPVLNNDEIEISTTPEPNVVSSAQAFIQGLYPPTPELASLRGLLSYSTDVNGHLIDYPLNGYQYPVISTYRAEDPMSAHISGHKNCPQHTNAVRAFAASKEFHDVFDSTQAFYSNIYSRILFGVYPRDMASIYHATAVYEYLQYQYTYNSTARDIISRTDVDTARQYANQWAHATSSGADVHWSKDRVLAIAGRSLAYAIMRSLQQNERSKGSFNKLSLIFGGYEPLMAFLEIVVSKAYRESLSGLPNHGASVMIDLFSMAEDGIAEFPTDNSKLMVRLLIRNGTDASDPESQFKQYPMFGTNNKEIAMPYKDFVDQMVFNMKSTSEWCRSCNGQENFCYQYAEHKSTKKCDFTTLPPLDTGALIGLGAVSFALLTLALSCTFCMWRGHRHRRKLRWNHVDDTESNANIISPGSSRDIRMSAPPSIAPSNKSNTSSYNEDIEMLLSPACQPVKVRDTV